MSKSSQETKTNTFVAPGMAVPERLSAAMTETAEAMQKGWWLSRWGRAWRAMSR